MNFFKRLLGNTITDNDTKTEIENISVNENLFRTDEEPAVQPTTRTENAKPALRDILNRDFESMGFQDGYNTHRPEQLTNRVKSISAEFRMIYQSELQEIDSDLLKLNSYLTENVKEHIGVIQKE